MQITVVQKSVRQSPRKVRLVVNAVRKLSLEQAILQLGQIQRRSTLVVLKTLRQAVANAQHNHGLSASDLKIVSIQVGEGTRFKRFQPVSRGRAHSIVKRSCQITVILETTESAKPEEKKAKIVEPTKKVAESVKTEISEKIKRPSQPKVEKVTRNTVVVSKQTRTKRPVAK